MESKTSESNSVSFTGDGESQARVERLPFQVTGSTGDYLAAARELFQKGDYRNAIIHLYSHTLLTLDQRGLIRLRRGKTNRQYLGEVRRHQDVAKYLEACMISFEDAFFGNIDVTRNQIQPCFDNWETFDQTVNQTSAVH